MLVWIGYHDDPIKLFQQGNLFLWVLPCYEGHLESGKIKTPKASPEKAVCDESQAVDLCSLGFAPRSLRSLTI